MTKIIAIACQRGGVAKTTTAAALAQAAAHDGQKVLAIDLDPQGNLSLYTGTSTARPGSYDLITGEAHLMDTIQTQRTGPDVIPASWSLQTVTTSRGSARRLKTALEPARLLYDIIIIDTPPTAGELQLNAIMAASDLIIPVQADIAGLQGLYQMSETVKRICQSGHDVHTAGYILTRARLRTTLARQLSDTIKEKAEELGILFLGAVREAVAIQEAQALQQDLYEYAPNSNPAIDYMAIYRAIRGN